MHGPKVTYALIPLVVVQSVLGCVVECDTCAMIYRYDHFMVISSATIRISFNPP